MDKKTIETYNNEAENIAKLHSSLTPHRIYKLIEQYFLKCGVTVDIGCGIGRDTNWLNSQGFKTIGIDASKGMLKQARKLYPNLIFKEDYLPELATLKNKQFQNILCSAVLMHLDNKLINESCLRLLNLLKNDGCLIISIRGTNAEDNRENGKLYQNIDTELLKQFFINQGCDVLLHESEIEQKRLITWHNFVIKK